MAKIIINTINDNPYGNNGHAMQIIAKGQNLQTPIQIIGATPLHSLPTPECQKPHCFCHEVFDQDDKTHFLVEFPSMFVIYEFVLLKNGVPIATAPTAGLGLEDFGSFTDYPERVRLTIDWQQIALIYGYGKYQISLFIASEERFYSDCFKLSPFSCSNAANTVKLISTAKGIYQRGQNRFDLKTMEHKDEIRVKGRFLPSESPFSVEEIFAVRPNSLRQYDSKMNDNYSLRIDHLTYEVFSRICYFINNGHELTISNYNSLDVIQATKVKSLSTGDNSLGFNTENKYIFNSTISYRSAFAAGHRLYR